MQTKLKLFALSISTQLILNRTVLYYCTEFYTRTAPSKGGILFCTICAVIAPNSCKKKLQCRTAYALIRPERIRQSLSHCTRVQGQGSSTYTSTLHGSSNDARCFESLLTKWCLEPFKTVPCLMTSSQRVQVAKRKRKEEKEKNLLGASHDQKAPEPS